LAASLAQAVEALTKLPVWGRETRRGSHIDLLFEGTIEISCFYIELTEFVVI
jgi:hypothetical protein